MPRLPSERVGICSFPESPYKGQPCDCAGCNYDPKCTGDCGCYVLDGKVYDCEGQVQGCRPPEPGED